MHTTTARALRPDVHLSNGAVAEAAEWKALEEASETTDTMQWKDYSSAFIDRAPKYSDRPHRDSYGAELPMRTSYSANGYPRIAALTPAEKRYLAERAKVTTKAPKAVIRPNSPHPDSYGAELPLRGGGMRREGGPKYKWALTAEEKALLAARPVKYSRRVA